ncbi:MAG: hypothetical protein ACI376_02100 [Candidatus Bruticola sp.]
MKFDTEIRQIIPLCSDTCAKATVMFRLGPLMVKGAKIFEKNNSRWLSMPAKRTKNGRWLEALQFTDKQDKLDLQDAVLAQYDLILAQQEEELAYNSEQITAD